MGVYFQKQKYSACSRVYGWSLTNTSAAFKYVKLHNLAAAPTVGTTPVVDTIAIPPNSTINFVNMIGVAYATGIAMSITNLPADADTTAVAANDVVGNVYFA